MYNFLIFSCITKWHIVCKPSNHTRKPIMTTNYFKHSSYLGKQLVVLAATYLLKTLTSKIFELIEDPIDLIVANKF